MKETIFLNGKFVDPKEANISVLNPGFLLGYGLFETMRLYHNKIIYFGRHIERIRKSSDLLGIPMPYTIGKIKAIINEIVKLNWFCDNYVKLTLWKSDGRAGILVISREYSPYPAKKYQVGFRVCVSKFRQAENSFLSGIKTTSRVMLELAYAFAKEKKFDEALILNGRGYIAEASRSNIFFVKGNELFTPSLACGCLKGITRQAVFDLAGQCNIIVNEGEFTLDDLYNADEAFLTNSLIGIMPLVSVGKIAISRAGRITRLFIAKYNEWYGNDSGEAIATAVSLAPIKR